MAYCLWKKTYAICHKLYALSYFSFFFTVAFFLASFAGFASFLGASFLVSFFSPPTLASATALRATFSPPLLLACPSKPWRSRTS